MRVFSSILSALLILCSLGTSMAAIADDAQPGFLEIKETTQNRFKVLWRAPKVSSASTGSLSLLSLKLPETVKDISPVVRHELNNSLVETRLIESDNAGLEGKRIEVEGLKAANNKVLVRIEFANGATTTTLLKPENPWMLVRGPRTAWEVTWDYTVLGVEHILIGFDHLLFVLALVLIVKGTKRLLLTITAFTLAHSITLALATLGFVNLPGIPVETIIALSILFLAVELYKINQGQQSLTAKYPWVVAFSFGLLHGLGFAGALSDIGLPQHEIPLALLMFNVGVELGQVLFVFVILAIGYLIKQIKPTLPLWVKQVPVYGIGGMSAYWFIERLSGF